MQHISQCTEAKRFRENSLKKYKIRHRSTSTKKLRIWYYGLFLKCSDQRAYLWSAVLIVLLLSVYLTYCTCYNCVYMKLYRFFTLFPSIRQSFNSNQISKTLPTRLIMTKFYMFVWMDGLTTKIINLIWFHSIFFTIVCIISIKMRLKSSSWSL